MEISSIHYAICRLALGILVFKRDIFMVSILDLMSENTDCVSGRTIFTMTKTLRINHIGRWRCIQYLSPFIFFGISSQKFIDT